MIDGWGYGGSPSRTSASGTVTLVEGMTFCICGPNGDIVPGAEQGLFFRDTRFLSQFELTVDGRRLEPLAVRCPAPYAGTFVCRRPPRPGRADSTLLVVRRRYVGNGLLEELTVRNLGRETAGVDLQLDVGADFAGLFEVKEGRAQPHGHPNWTVEEPAIRLADRRGQDERAVSVVGTGEPTSTRGRLHWALVVAPQTTVTVSAQVIPAVEGRNVPARYRPGHAPEHSEPAARMAAWRAMTPAVSTPEDGVMRLLTRSSESLGALRIHDPENPERVVVAAGAPWFMTLFGRDSLLTGWMLLPLDPTIALGTLQTLAELQGREVNPLTEEEPGRILHEVRSGFDAGVALGGGNVYYGSVDATPLFVMLLGELRRWGAARSEVDALLPHADAALDWIENYGDRDGDGFVEYRRATDRGLLHQGWKDSFDAVSNAAGVSAETPIALAEVQGYVYAAYLARAHFAAEAGQRDAAADFADRARALKRRFNEAFWLPDRGYYAMALDADKRPVDALASNMGHCLWTGIVDEDKATSVSAALMSPQMFSGFGIRTLATSMAAYNPMSYHNGSVWPHDNAIAAAGLMRYGFVDAAQRVALGLFDAAQRLDGELPELFCGFDREEFPSPIGYPTSCAPQAWSAATPVHLLRTLLRFDPWVPFGRVWCAPAVPDSLLPMRIEGVNLAGVQIDVHVDAHGASVTGLPESLELVAEARSPLTAAVPASISAETTILGSDV